MYTKYAKLRDSKGLNDNKVAEMTGIPASTIYDWKQRSDKDSKANLSFENTVKIAKLFEVPVDYFAEEVG